MKRKERILFLDLLRALAVLMMILGHTADVFLSDYYRNTGFVLFDVWESLRAYTAPVFMFVAGTVFTFLLNIENPSVRIRKGLMRGISLIVIGYLLRYPSHKIFIFDHVALEGWITFFSVDALHLIGIGLIVIICSYYLCGKLYFKQNFFYIFLSLLIFAAYPWSKTIDWLKLVSYPAASYFTKNTGSIFPVFPYLGFMLEGALLGLYVARKNAEPKGKIDFKPILIISVCLVCFSYILRSEYSGFGHGEYYEVLNISGVILLLVSAAIRFGNILKPAESLLMKIGKRSLTVYIVHLIVLYGCAWCPGLNRFFGNSFGVTGTIASVIFMELLMISLVVFLERKPKPVKVILTKSCSRL